MFWTFWYCDVTLVQSSICCLAERASTLTIPIPSWTKNLYGRNDLYGRNHLYDNSDLSMIECVLRREARRLEHNAKLNCIANLVQHLLVLWIVVEYVSWHCLMSGVDAFKGLHQTIRKSPCDIARLLTTHKIDSTIQRKGGILG
jgi:hypothetical protein